MEVLFAIATINRVKDHNALNTAVLKRLDEIFVSLDSGDSVRGIIVTGAARKLLWQGPK